MVSCQSDWIGSQLSFPRDILYIQLPTESNRVSSRTTLNANGAIIAYQLFYKINIYFITTAPLLSV